MDEYDMCHVVSYDIIINVYNNDDIVSVINDVITNYNLENTEELRESFYKIINEIRYSFNILEYRTITNIGSRLIIYQRNKRLNCLIQV